MNKIKAFFWICSGVHIPLLKKCEVESSKYAGIGATIFFTGLFAAFAAAYALYTVFDNWWIAALLGLVWGLMIFNLDRFIVSSMRKAGGFPSEARTAIPRIILAIIISIVIVKPLELKIFEKEILAELVIIEQQTYGAQEAGINARYQSQQLALDDEIALLKKEIDDKTSKRDALDRLAQEEADGTGGTRKRNAGPIYAIKRRDADRVNEELQSLRQRNDSLIHKATLTRSTIDRAITDEIAAIDRQKIDGPASRLEALNRITSKSSAIWWASLFITLLFIAIETAPVVVKLLSSRGPYDDLLDVEEHAFAANRFEEKANLTAVIKKRGEPLPKTESDYLHERLDIGLHKA
jgi:hypothetical protein